nr:hypothetical protein [Candidatus Freyarchaeota archaeon]
MKASLIRTMRFDIESNNTRLLETLKVFRDMVNKMLEYGQKNKVYSAPKSEKHFWKPFRDKYGLMTHYTTSASRYAAGLFRSHFGLVKAWKELGLLSKEPGWPTQKKLCMRLQPVLAHLELVDGSLELHVTTEPRKEPIKLALRSYPYAEPLIEAWAAEKLKVGEITIKPSEVYVPFKREVTCSEDPVGVMYFDTNLNTLDFIIATKSGVYRGFKLDISLIQKIRDKYIEKVERIRKIHNQKAREELLEKYLTREKRLINYPLQIVSSLVAGISERYGGLCAVFGNLTGIRNSIKKLPRSRKLKQQLRLWSFERLQRLCEFKLLRNPFKVPEWLLDPIPKRGIHFLDLSRVRNENRETQRTGVQVPVLRVQWRQTHSCSDKLSP